MFDILSMSAGMPTLKTPILNLKKPILFYTRINIQSRRFETDCFDYNILIGLIKGF